MLRTPGRRRVVSSVLVLCVLTFSPPVHADLTLDISPNTGAPDRFSGICETTEICRASGCAAFPSLGEVLLIIDDGEGRLGPSEDMLDPVEVFGIFDTPPDRVDELGLRVLIEQPSDDALGRRYAFVDRTRPAPPDQYFVLHCTEAPL